MSKQNVPIYPIVSLFNLEWRKPSATVENKSFGAHIKESLAISAVCLEFTRKAIEL